MQPQATKREPQRPSARVAQKEGTRRRLLAAARAQFRKQGVEPVSMEDVANAAEVSRATIYLHFAGKPALLEALLEEDWDGQVRLFERFCKLDLLNPSQLDEWVMNVAAGMVKARDSFAIHLAALGHNPGMVLRHQEHRKRLAQILRGGVSGPAPDDPKKNLRYKVESEQIVAELEYFAIAVALGTAPDEVAIAAELIETRLRALAQQAM